MKTDQGVVVRPCRHRRTRHWIAVVISLLISMVHYNEGGVDANKSHLGCPVSSSKDRHGAAPCLVYLSDRIGHFSTPKFPASFATPFKCKWVINATGYDKDSYISLYFTQMYLTGGIKVLRYSFHGEASTFGRDLGFVGGKDGIYVKDSRSGNVRMFSDYRIKARFLEIQLNLPTLMESSIRVENRLTDVYGFNITYEIQANNSQKRADVCSAANCTFNGHCYANRDYSRFQCSCLPGFSGKYCQYGPGCNDTMNVCKNNGTCGYKFGHTLVQCTCPANFKGSFCELMRETIPSKECFLWFKLNCSHDCAVDSDQVAHCKCPPGYGLKTDRLTCYPLCPQGLLGHLKISTDEVISRNQIQAELQNQIYNSTLHMLSVGAVDIGTSGLVTFQVWSSYTMIDHLRNESRRTINYSNSAMVNGTWTWDACSADNDKKWAFVLETGESVLRGLRTIGKTGVSISNNDIVRVSALVIEWITVNARNRQALEGGMVEISCQFNGQRRVEWFKDGFAIDVDYSLRNISITIDDADRRGFYRSYLKIRQVTANERGEYQCRVSHWGQVVRQFIFLDVVTKPILNLAPANPTFQLTDQTAAAGSTVTFICRDENDLARRTITTYSWLRNGVAITSNPCETIDTLLPVGSMLKVTNLQHSTNYSCRARNQVGQTTHDTRVSLIRRHHVACPGVQSMNISWSTVVVDSTDHQPCAAGYVGLATRKCRSLLKSSTHSSSGSNVTWAWQDPDFSGCTPVEINQLSRKLKLLALGYVVTNVTWIIESVHKYIKDVPSVKKSQAVAKLGKAATYSCLPGEGNSVVDLLANIQVYLWRKSDVFPAHFWASSAITYLRVIDSLLSTRAHYFSPDKITSVIKIVQNHVALLSRTCPTVLDTLTIGWKNMLFYNANASGKWMKNVEISNGVDFQQMKLALDVKQNDMVLSSPIFAIPDARSWASDFAATSVLSSFNRTPIESLVKGRYVCAFLQLEPLKASASWDLNTCVPAVRNMSFVDCNCPRFGTTFLAYVEDLPTEQELQSPYSFLIWILIWISVSLTHFVLVVILATLLAKWYYKRTWWCWFQVQLNVAVIVLSTVYIAEPNQMALDTVWPFFITSSIYWYLSTILVIGFSLKLQSNKQNQTEPVCDRNNVRIVSISIGCPLALTLVGAFVEFVPSLSRPSSWFRIDGSASSIVFYIVFIVLLLTSTATCALLMRQLIRLNVKAGDSREQDGACSLKRRIFYCKCCLLLAGFIAHFTVCIVVDQHLMSAAFHCASSCLHFFMVLAWSVLMVMFSEDGRPVWLCCKWIGVSRLASNVPPDDVTGVLESPLQDRFVDAVVPGDASVAVVETAHCLNDETSDRTDRVPDSLDVGHKMTIGDSFHNSIESVGHNNKLADKVKIDILIPVDLASPQLDVDTDKYVKTDSDSGFGTSGGSRKLEALEKLSEAWKNFCQLRQQISERFPWNSSLRTESSTATTTDRSLSGSNMTTDTGVLSPTSDADLIPHIHRRLRAKWLDDYDDRLGEMNRGQRSENIDDLKPYRAKCFLRCSPELKPRNESLFGDKMALQSPALLQETQTKLNVLEKMQNYSCNIKSHTGRQLFCTINGYAPVRKSGPFATRAIVEKTPETEDVASVDDNGNGYVPMDPAGSLAVEDHSVRWPYYNVKLSQISVGRAGVCDRNASPVARASRRRCQYRRRSDYDCESSYLRLAGKSTGGAIQKKYRKSVVRNACFRHSFALAVDKDTSDTFNNKA